MSQDPLTGEAKPGDRIRWNCTFGQSRPKASLTWLINGEPVTQFTNIIVYIALLDYLILMEPC